MLGKFQPPNFANSKLKFSWNENSSSRELKEGFSFRENKSQFHQHFMSNFYTRRSQKHYKDSQLKQLFALLGSACVKAARKHVDEIDPKSGPAKNVWLNEK